MKIALFSTFDRRGGAALAALRLHKGLRLLEQESWMLVKEKSGQDFYVRPMDLPARKIRKEEAVFRLIEQQVFSEKRTALSNTRFSLPYPGYDLSKTDVVKLTDIVNLHWVALYQSIESVAALLESGKPVVWTLHDMNPFSGGCHYSAGCLGYRRDCLDCPQLGENPLQLPAKILQVKRKLWRRNLTIVTPSRWLAECARQSSVFRDFRVEVIPNSLETDVFFPRDKSAAKEALGLDRKQLVLLFSTYSDKEKRKGFKELVRALQRCLKNTRFRELAAKGAIQILNLGPAQDKIAEQDFAVRDLGVINGMDKVAAIYAAADIFVMPSLEENLANAMLEALACATPVLGFDVGGTPDMIQNGVTGFLVPVSDSDKFAERLLELVFNQPLREQMGENGRRLIESKFKLQDQAVNYLELFRDLVKKSHVNAALPAADDVWNESAIPEFDKNRVPDCLEDFIRQNAPALPKHAAWNIFKNRSIHNLWSVKQLLKNNGGIYTAKTVLRKLICFLKKIIIRRDGG
jgi:glycosyltransferase involved in cell wall biosynthesis